MPAHLHGTDERGGGLDCLLKKPFRIESWRGDSCPKLPNKNVDHCVISGVQAAGSMLASGDFEIQPYQHHEQPP